MSVEGLILGMKQATWYFAVVRHISKPLDTESEIYIIMKFPKGEWCAGSY